MSIDLRELDLADEQQLRDFHEVTRRAEREDGREWTRAWTFDEMLSRLREPDPTERVEACAAYSAGFAFESFVGLVPDALIASYCALHNKLAVEAPGGEFDWEEESITPEILREFDRKMTSIGRERHTTVAVRDGVVVAFTDIIVTKGETRAAQWYTIVDRDFRGHRLGAAVKVANLRQVLAAHPEVTEVHTTNAETNAKMVDINDRLGYQPVALCPGFLRDLT